MRSDSRERYRLLLSLFPAWFREDFGDELRAHLACQRREARYAGRTTGAVLFWWEAGRDAVVTGLSLRVRGARGAGGELRAGHGNEGGVVGTFEALMRDLRHALRGLAKSPGYAMVFVVTLGLGIGANTAMFSVVNGVLLQPLPHEDGDRLVYLRHTARLAGIDNVLFSVPEVNDYRSGTPSLASVAEFSAMDFTMLGHDTPRQVRTGIVTGNYFGVMGLSAAIGRTVGPEDDGAAADPVVVLSDRYWRSTFGTDPEVLGRTLQMNGLTATIVGVAEPAPPYPEQTDIYVNLAASPHHLDATMTHDRIHRMTEVFARLAPGGTVESVLAEASTVTARIHQDHSDAYDTGSGYEVTVTPLKDQLTSRARPTFLLLLGTAFFVLVIACANLANLTLTRVLRRDHEMAIRLSLGGSRTALRRELLVESLVLAAGGAALGLLIASVSLDVLIAFAERFTSRASEIALDANVFGYALLAAVAASVFFTMIPALPDGNRLGATLTRSGTRSTVGSRAKRAQRGLVVAQIATSFVLLIGAGLLMRTMMHLQRLDPGFDTDQVLAMDVPVAFGTIPEAELRERSTSILDEVRTLPGVRAAALTNVVPLSTSSAFSMFMQIDVDGYEPAPGEPTPRAEFRAVTPDYFEAMGIQLLDGRDFTITDVSDAQNVLVINETVARTFFGTREAVGQGIAWTDDISRLMGLSTEPRTIVGVVADTRDAGLDAPILPTIYNAYSQTTPYLTGSLVVRAEGDPIGVEASVRDVILRHNPDQPIVNVATIADLGSESVAPRRLNAMLLGAFALLALVIAAVGIGGVLAFSVGSRTREFGVRSALGAERRQVWSGVVAEGAALAIAGVLVGALGAVALARFIASLLVGVPALDPVTFVGVGLLLCVVAIGAAWIPAWRAAAVSPMEALGSE